LKFLVLIFLISFTRSEDEQDNIAGLRHTGDNTIWVFWLNTGSLGDERIYLVYLFTPFGKYLNDDAKMNWAKKVLKVSSNLSFQLFILEIKPLCESSDVETCCEYKKINCLLSNDNDITESINYFNKKRGSEACSLNDESCQGKNLTTFQGEVNIFNLGNFDLAFKFDPDKGFDNFDEYGKKLEKVKDQLVSEFGTIEHKIDANIKGLEGRILTISTNLVLNATSHPKVGSKKQSTVEFEDSSSLPDDLGKLDMWIRPDKNKSVSVKLDSDPLDLVTNHKEIGPDLVCTIYTHANHFKAMKIVLIFLVVLTGLSLLMNLILMIVYCKA